MELTRDAAGLHMGLNVICHSEHMNVVFIFAPSKINNLLNIINFNK